MLNSFLYWYTVVFFTITMISVLAKVVKKVTGNYDGLPTPVQIEELITIPFLMLGFLAMWGYITNTKYISPTFWQIYVLLFFAQQIVAFRLPKQKWIRSELTNIRYVWANASAIVVSLPMYYMLVVYAFAEITIEGGV